MTPHDDAALLALAERDEARYLARVRRDARIGVATHPPPPLSRGQRSRLRARARAVVGVAPCSGAHLARELGLPREVALGIATDAGLVWHAAAGVWRLGGRS